LISYQFDFTKKQISWQMIKSVWKLKDYASHNLEICEDLHHAFYVVFVYLWFFLLFTEF